MERIEIVGAMRVSVETCGCSVFRAAHIKNYIYNNNYNDNDVILAIDELQRSVNSSAKHGLCVSIGKWILMTCYCCTLSRGGNGFTKLIKHEMTLRIQQGAEDNCIDYVG